MANIPLQIDSNTGMLKPVRFVASPNFDERPNPDDISLLVVHGISLPPGEFGGSAIDALFTNSLNPDEHPYYAEIHQMKVSSHLLIRRDGKITQYVPLNKRAWHAGQSHYLDRPNCNDFSIGIELEGTDDIAYEKAQYETLATTTRVLMQHYEGISHGRIVGHCDIAPVRKTDPGPAFDWAFFRKLLV